MGKKAKLILIILVLCLAGATSVGYALWQRQKRIIRDRLSVRLSQLGVAPPVEVRKSKLDADDMELKIWFGVPNDKRIVDVFWFKGEFCYTVMHPDHRKVSTLSDKELEAFLATEWQPATEQ